MTDSTEITWSPQQEAIFDFVKHGRGSLFVDAKAGTGKTTTMVQATSLMHGSIAFTAYNKKIADEIKARVAELHLGNRVRVGTFHSFGFSAWRRVYPDVEVDADRKRDLIQERLGLGRDDEDKLSEEAIKLAPFVTKLIGLAKQRALGLFGSIDDDSRWYDIVDHFDLAYEIEDDRLIARGIELAQEGLMISRDMAPELIDFDDMLYMPIVSGIRMWENDWVIVDEAQDTNPARRALARKMLRKNGRAAFVGDKFQAIYGFTGADNDAVDYIIRDFNCHVLPLSVTYRCPKAVVAVAQEQVPDIVAHETAPEGVVSTSSIGEIDRMAKDGQLRATDAILCRNTRPLVEMAYSLIRRDVPCHVEGRDIGLGLVKLVNRFQAVRLDTLLRKLDAWAELEMAKLVAKGKETQAQSVEDRVETLKVIASDCKSVDELRQRIASLFVDSENERKPTLTLSTVHKSKGREWDRVFILGRYELMPSPWARQSWQVQQEYNLIYVAVTRSKGELVIVPSLDPTPLTQEAEERRAELFEDQDAAHERFEADCRSVVGK